MKLDELRRLAEEIQRVTPGPWSALTHGTRSQLHAADEAARSVLATRVQDAPEIEFTDLSWLDTTPDAAHLALVGNGPGSPERAKYLAACDPATILRLLDVADAARHLRDLLTGQHWEPWIRLNAALAALEDES